MLVRVASGRDLSAKRRAARQRIPLTQSAKLQHAVAACRAAVPLSRRACGAQAWATVGRRAGTQPKRAVTTSATDLVMRQRGGATGVLASVSVLHFHQSIEQ